MVYFVKNQGNFIKEEVNEMTEEVKAQVRTAQSHLVAAKCNTDTKREAEVMEKFLNASQEFLKNGGDLAGLEKLWRNE